MTLQRHSLKKSIYKIRDELAVKKSIDNAKYSISTKGLSQYLFLPIKQIPRDFRGILINKNTGSPYRIRTN